MRFFLLVSVLLLGGCENLPSWTWVQKTEVFLETPEGPVSASAVARLTRKHCPRWNCFAITHETRHVSRGEGVFFDLGPRGYLVMPRPYTFLRSTARPFHVGSEAYWEEIEAALDHLRPPKMKANAWFHLKLDYRSSHLFAPREVRMENMPAFAWYPPGSDFTGHPEYVDPEDLHTVLGEGVRLLRVEVSIVDEPITCNKMPRAARQNKKLHNCGWWR